MPTPLPIADDAAPVVLFGGTFDPPHEAHTRLADAARRKVERRHAAPAWLAFVPAARSPHKKDAPHATDSQRVEMLRLATSDIERCTVWTDEIDRARSNEPSFWLTTLQRARQVLGRRALSFIIGTDQAANLHRWREPRAMLELAEPIVLPRAPLTTASALRAAVTLASFWTEEELLRWADALVEVAHIRAASSTIRAAQGAPVDTPMHPRVIEYARRNNLYGIK